MNDEVELYDSLDGQVALVTGATKGLGAKIASKLVEFGATVYAGAEELSKSGLSSSEKIRYVQLDVTEERDIANVVDQIRKEEESLDVLVNNAAIHGPSGRVSNISVKDMNDVIKVNLVGPMAVCRYSLPLMVGKEGSRIINITSTSGRFSVGISTSHPPYAISKAGVNALTCLLSEQYEHTMINSVSPGWIKTDMGGPDAPLSVEQGAMTPLWLACIKPGGPSGHNWFNMEIVDW